MQDYLRPELAIILLIIIPPAIAAAIFARNRGRNILVWSVISAIFPIFLMIIYFEKPLKEVPGGFKRCLSCGEFIKWKVNTCKYCQAEQSVKS
jgi:hypothetical protein